eukprot:7255053-Prymnesium_polylepis.1
MVPSSSRTRRGRAPARGARSTSSHVCCHSYLSRVSCHSALQHAALRSSTRVQCTFAKIVTSVSASRSSRSMLSARRGAHAVDRSGVYFAVLPTNLKSHPRRLNRS